jgi:demethoxyubiquinone hydroxylase (CLK1/Coq7/Cat5 family)
MDYRLHPVDRLDETGAGCEVALHCVDQPARIAGEDPRPMSPLAELRDDELAKRAGAASHENVQSLSPKKVSAIPPRASSYS